MDAVLSGEVENVNLMLLLVFGGLYLMRTGDRGKT
jgi:hypothetical protein